MTLEHFLRELKAGESIYLEDNHQMAKYHYSLLVEKTLWDKTTYDITAYRVHNEFETLPFKTISGDKDFLFSELRDGTTILSRLDWKIYRTRRELEAENAALKAELALLREHITKPLKPLKEKLQGYFGKNFQNSAPNCQPFGLIRILFLRLAALR